MWIGIVPTLYLAARMSNEGWKMMDFECRVYSTVFLLAEDLQTESGPVPAVSRCQKLLQGTSFTILVAAVSKSPSVLGSIEADKAESVARHAGVSWPTQNLKVPFSHFLPNSAHLCRNHLQVKTDLTSEICVLQEVEAGLRKKAWNYLSEACSRAEEEVQSCPRDCVDSSSIIHTYMALANFCDKVLREHEQGDAGVCVGVCVCVTNLSGF